MLVASPAVVYRVGWSETAPVAQPWVYAASPSVSLPAVDSAVTIPVELIARGKEPEWVYVQVENQAVPEPGACSLLVLASLLLVFRRQRA